ncbi:DUF4150 domain-containing protein [Sulfurimonas sp. MAG313]|nr:PAAR-like domain-containing protein [Sulfurimonas sp. MAG313]MDF1880493.1 DUF4150 domain-containing protein [Sulfurimonas sp. MAG313]
MASNFGARKDDKYKVVCSAPSVNKTQVGNAVVPIPYNVMEKFAKAADVSEDVMFNGKAAYHKGSNSTKVTGDSQGSIGGVVSGTVGDLSEPVEFSSSLKINGEFAIRDGDLHKMQGGNTIGKVTTTESGSREDITDEGEVEESNEDTSPYSSSSSTKPTASSASGSLGSMTGSPVLLKTGQFIYTTEELELWGKFPLSLERTYLSNSNHKGMFGNDWHYKFEREFKHVENNLYRLYLGDGRHFDFEKNEDNTFTDLGKLGTQVKEIKPNHFTLTCFQGRIQTFVRDKLIQIQDLNNNTIKLYYNENLQIEKIINSEESSFTFTYNKDKLVEKALDHTNRTWTYKYDENHNLRSVSNPIQAQTSYTYIKHNESLLLSKVTDALGRVKLSVTYTNDAKVQSYTQKEQVFTYTYINKTMISKKDNNADQTSYGLDENGLIRAISYPDDSKSKEDYNPENKTATITDQGGNTTVKVFDERDRLIKEINQSKQETLYEYEGVNPNPISIASGEELSSFTYDKNYNLLSFSTPEESGELEYDENFNVIKSVDNLGNKISYEYNEFNKVALIIDALGGETRILYDGLGRQTEIVDSENRNIVIEYNFLDKTIKTKDNQGYITSFIYDKSNAIISITDAMKNITSYTYDNHARLKDRIRANNSMKTFRYNIDDTIKTITDEDGTFSTFYYNKAQCLIKIVTDGEEVKYNYDNLGNLLEATNENSHIEYYYDAHANVICESQNYIDIHKTYNEKHQLKQMNFLNQVQSYYQRDDNGKVSEIKNSTSTILLNYDDNGIITQRIYPNDRTEDIVYDKNYNTLSIKTADETLVYTHDKTGLILSKNDSQYIYDENSRLIQTPHETFTYDKAGNNLNHHAIYNQYTYQLEENENFIFTYDLKSNLKSKENKQTSAITHYTFNKKNQLIDLVKKDKEGLIQLTLSYSYDALNRRIEKRKDGVTHKYLYNGENIVAVLDEGNKLLASISHGEKVDTPLSITTYNNEEFELTVAEQSYFHDLNEEEKEFLLNKKRQRTYFYHRDQQGSIIALTDEAGNIVESFIYDESYGKILEHNKTAQTYNPYGYTAREMDSADLYYYRARYYDPTTQRFLSEDPIEFMSGDFNWYRYVNNNPVNYTDPTGLFLPILYAIGVAIAEGIAAYGATATAVATAGTLAVRVGPSLINSARVLSQSAPKIGNAIRGASRATPQVNTQVKEKEDEDTKASAGESASVQAGAKVKGKGKDVECGDKGMYKDQKNPSKNGLERDHIPSQASVAQRTADDLGIGIEELGSCIKNRLKNWAETLALPKAFHKQGRTNGPKNTKAQIEGDSKNLGDAVDEDIKAYEDQLDDSDIPEECKKKIKKALEEIKKKTDEELNDFIDKQVDHCIEAGKFTI